MAGGGHGCTRRSGFRIARGGEPADDATVTTPPFCGGRGGRWGASDEQNGRTVAEQCPKVGPPVLQRPQWHGGQVLKGLGIRPQRSHVLPLPFVRAGEPEPAEGDIIGLTTRVRLWKARG